METVEIKNNRKRRSRGPIIFLAVVIFLILIVWLLNSATTHKILNKSSDDFPKLDVDGKYIGRIYVEGDIEEGEGGVFDEKSNYFHAETLNAIDQMIDDKIIRGYTYMLIPLVEVSAQAMNSTSKSRNTKKKQVERGLLLPTLMIWRHPEDIIFQHLRTKY